MLALSPESIAFRAKKNVKQWNDCCRSKRGTHYKSDARNIAAELGEEHPTDNSFIAPKYDVLNQ